MYLKHWYQSIQFVTDTTATTHRFHLGDLHSSDRMILLLNHFDAFNDQKEKSVLWKLAWKHRHESLETQIKIKARCFGKLTKHLISEAVLLDELNEKESINQSDLWISIGN